MEKWRDIFLLLPGQGGRRSDSETPEVDLFNETLDRWEVLTKKIPNIRARLIFPQSFALYAALVIAGVATAVAAREMIKRRTEIIRESETNTEYPTGMASILGFNSQQAADLIAGINDDIRRRNDALPKGREPMPLIEIVGDNGPTLQVVGGSVQALNRLKGLGDRFRMLPISGVLHHSVREADSRKYARVLEGIDYNEPDRDGLLVIASTRPRLLTSGAGFIEELVGQMYRQVNIPEAARIWRGIREAVDNGPGRMMGRMVQRVDPSLDVISADEPPEKIEEWLSRSH